MVYLRALGTAQIDAGTLQVTPAAIRKFALLLRLCAEPGRYIPRSALRELVYPDLAERNARHSLRDVVYQFRQAGVSVESESDGLMLAHGQAQTDWESFVRAKRPDLGQLSAIEGGFLPAYAPEHSEAFSDWLASYRAKATFQLCRALATTIKRARGVSDWKLTERAARACLVLDPLHEDATFALAEMLAVNGSKARAVRLLDQYSRAVSRRRADLSLPASVVKRRISERITDTYRSSLTLPFLGRDDEMTSLRERFELARGGESQCIALVGDAGIGKTRLAEEFCVQVALDGGRVERIVTQPHDAHRPMATFADLVPRLLQLPGALGCSPDSMAALRRLTSTETSDAIALEAGSSSEVVATSISRAIADLVDAIGAESTLVLLVDDVQWADELSRQMMASLVATKHRRRLLVILTSRDRTIVQFFARRSERLLSVTMAPLSQDVVTEVVSRTLESNDVVIDGEFRTWIAQASGGNPFFLRCLIVHFQATGERFVVPTAINGFLDQQLAAVGQEALALLGMSVVLGRHADIDRLVTALELPHFQLQLGLRDLESSYLIVQDGRRIGPAHWLVAEAVSRATPPISQRLYHRRAATILEQETDGTSSPALWDCAEHWIAAGEKDHALRVMRACATRSVEIGRPRQAAEILLRAVTLVDGAHRSELLTAAVRLGDEASEQDLMLKALTLSEDLGVPIAYDEFALAKIQAQFFESVDTTDVYSKLRPWLGVEHPMDLRVRACTAILMAAEKLEDAAQAHQAVSDLLPTSLDQESVDDIPTMTVLLIYNTAFGDSRTAVALARRLLSRAEREAPPSSANVRRKAGVALWICGHATEALDAFELAYSTAAACGLRRLQCAIASMLATFYLDVFDDARAMRWWNELDELAGEIPEFFSSFHYATLCADIACSRADVEGVRHSLDRILQLNETHPTPLTMRWIRILSAQLGNLMGSTRYPETVVKGLLEHHLPHSVMGAVGDLEVAAAAEVLLAGGQAERAQFMVRQYFVLHRRTCDPVCRWLQSVASRMQWQLPVCAPTPFDRAQARTAHV